MLNPHTDSPKKTRLTRPNQLWFCLLILTQPIAATSSVNTAWTPSINAAATPQTTNSSTAASGAFNGTVQWTLSSGFRASSSSVLNIAPTTIATSQAASGVDTRTVSPVRSANKTFGPTRPVIISLTPLTTTLSAGQSTQFTATVGRTPDGAVNWTLSPAVGSISASGLYAAPSAITALQTVTLKATSVADPAKSASAVVTLVPPVSVALTPLSTTLSAGQSRQLTASVNGASDSAVTWTLTPTVGTISASGLYSAPSAIPALQTVTLKATSVADPAKSASAMLTLTPPVSVVLTPLSTTLAAGQSKQLSASVSGAADSAVTWTLTPAVGTISASGLYSAPSDTTSAQTVMVKATSTADPTKAAMATVTLTGHAALPQRNTKYGVHMDLTWFGDPNFRDTRIHAAAQAGAQIGRNTLLWFLIEPTEGKLDWTDCDSVVSQMVQANIEPLFSVFGSPSWANGTAPSAADYYHVPQDPVGFQNWVDANARFVSAAARRYKDSVHRWELGNEQNWQGYWNPRPNLDQYVTWYRALSAAILAEDPAAEIAVGGLTFLTRKDSEIPPNISGVSFIKGLWQRGLYPRAIAIHPYVTTAGNQSSAPMIDVQAISAIHELFISNGSSSTDLWITEFGWLGTPVSQDLRAKSLSTALTQIDACLSSFVQIAIYFPLFDNPPSMVGGLFDSAVQATPPGSAFTEFVTTASASSGSTGCPNVTP